MKKNYVVKNSLCKQEDFGKPFYSAISGLMAGQPPIYHRKQWEVVMIIQALLERGKLKARKKGLGFGVGQEPMSAIFCNYGVKVLATDMPTENTDAAKWGKNELSIGLQTLNIWGLADQKTLEKRVSFKPVDMNNLPDDLGEFDFTWSSCCFEHLGSLEKGLQFLENQMKYLKKGGVAVHTTEFNLNSLEENGTRADTLSEGDTVLYRKSDIDAFITRMRGLGYKTEDVDYNPGNGSLDVYIDAPPYTQDKHLKLRIAQYNCTSLVLIIEK